MTPYVARRIRADVHVSGEVGVSGQRATSPPGNIVAVFVRPAHRGTGILRHLLAVTETWLRHAGTTQARLHVHEQNHRARSAYLKCGYIDTGVRLHVDGGWEHEMVRDLEDAPEVGPPVR